MQGVAVIGPGRIGGAIAVALSAGGYSIDEVVYRSRQPPKSLLSEIKGTTTTIQFGKDLYVRSPLILITVQDEELPRVVQGLQGKISDRSTILHTSGSISSEILKPFRKFDCKIASFHPLISITNWNDGFSGFKNAYFCIEGDNAAVQTGKKLASALEARWFMISPEKKGLYHASAVMAAGHVTALFDMAIDLMMKTGVKRSTARKLLQPLLGSVSTNLLRSDTPAALTGTYARGDEQTIQRHLASMRKAASKDELEVYLLLALRSIEIAEQNGLDPKKVRKMRRAIDMAKQ